MSVTPSWCFNPQKTWTVALALKVKAGKYFGWGSVQGENEKGEQKLFERNSNNAGYGIGWSPRLVLERDIGDKSLQLFGGWDSTDPGRGVSRLRSAYYSPKTVDLNGSAITAGAALIF
ncbi:hypothetical protein DIU31_006080 [Mucilaginibacter rubeus]|uniref:Uncharacterized protein n=1 Tax=Mucilaginibacter rubeus TaxID=2027860 RepID=A0AAE6MHC0_9SPHI|nr:MULTISPECIES: hypothetical protein [Mucilaginibacter]QEM03109.1 hypothetical protein DIU31_006080 [Mucilaginibacter rubeus]QEM15727.1 hypothetical protein DIU38_006150 [Mucilaginibacter gossypii]QTE41533.1 hypothetical protein J3L19_21630 [Mucilaginibacter rubeus]QTE48139.1 hypothetical protein J3L21_21630 [Mucilaginibacter rubeus]QTE59530.1 hypothetical protein J3L23_13275 [Mucilaginibacter rubeus]